MFQKLRQKERGVKDAKRSRLLIEESGLSFGEAFILHPSPERTHKKNYFTIQLTQESCSSLAPGRLMKKTHKLLRTKKNQQKKHLWEDIHRARSFKSPVSPHCLFQEWFSYKLKEPAQVSGRCRYRVHTYQRAATTT